MNKYSELLRDPRWQRRRLERLSRANWICERCSNGKNTLHVHHTKYISGRDPWDYNDDELEVLCFKCHEGEHPDKARKSAKRKSGPDSHYTKLCNAVGRDKRLSYCARGILLMASTHSAYWTFSVGSVRRGTDYEGQQTISKAIKQLQKYGYLKLTRLREGTKYTGSKWEWNFNPISEPDQAASCRADGSLAINPKFDDSGLDPYEYRLFYHIETSGCGKRSLDSIADICGMSRTKAKEVIATLKEKGMLLVTGEFGFESSYEAVPPGKWPICAAPTNEGGSEA